MTIVVRSAVPADLERVLAIAREIRPAAQWPEKEYHRALAPQAEQRRLVLVIGNEGEIQGFIIGHLAGDQWEIENLAVDRRAQRRGLGRALLHEFLGLARQRGSAVFLEVRESNVAARKLYEGMGFVESGRREAYYRAPEEDAIVLQFCFDAPLHP